MDQAPWFYVNADRQRQGPVPAETLRALVEAGTLGARSLVWRQGMPQWQPLEQVAGELGVALAPPMPPASAVSAAAPSATDASAPTGPARASTPSDGQAPLDADAAAGATRARDEALEAAYAASALGPAALGAIDGQEVVDAGFWKRFAALIIDGVILTVAMYALIFIMVLVIGIGAGGILTMFESSASGRPPEGPLLVVFILGFYVLPFLMRWAYYTFFTASEWQATLGKRAVGIKVVDLDGQRIGKGRATGRWFAAALSYLTLYIGFLMAAFTDRKMALHDYVASTRVVDRWAYTEHPERQNRRLGGCALAALIGGGLLIVLMMVGIMAAVSLPAYQDYTQRAQVAQVVAEGEAMTSAVDAFVANADRCPQDLDEAGVGVPSHPMVADAAIGENEDGACLIEFELQGTTPVDGEYLWFERSEAGGWRCSSSVADRHLPPRCRG